MNSQFIEKSKYPLNRENAEVHTKQINKNKIK